MSGALGRTWKLLDSSGADVIPTSRILLYTDVETPGVKTRLRIVRDWSSQKSRRRSPYWLDIESPREVDRALKSPMINIGRPDWMATNI
jgi:hypothetical protein